MKKVQQPRFRFSMVAKSILPGLLAAVDSQPRLDLVCLLENVCSCSDGFETKSLLE